MKNSINNIILYFAAVVAASLCSCSDSLFDDGLQNDGGSISLSADIEQLAVTRVNDSGFCNGGWVCMWWTTRAVTPAF